MKPILESVMVEEANSIHWRIGAIIHAIQQLLTGITLTICCSPLAGAGFAGTG
ncbi:MAG: hypothetical protein MI755_15200 [Sphingomonadales bacterium]|nr:hypothetical protein [Sphingomonadales bacterium]